MFNADQALLKLEEYEIGQQHGMKLTFNEFYSLSRVDRSDFIQGWRNQWKAEKRPLTKEEVVHAAWLKIGRHGHNLLVRPLPDGTLEECDLFFPKEHWQGSWHIIEEVVLVLQVGWYVLYVVGSKNGLHSGLEFDEQTGDVHDYYHVVAIRRIRSHGSVIFRAKNELYSPLWG